MAQDGGHATTVSMSTGYEKNAPAQVSGFVGARLLLWGLMVLMAGAMVYVLMRPSSVWCLPQSLKLSLALPAVLQPLTGALPSFAHTLAFALFTTAALGRWSGLAPAAAVWGGVNLFFELGQHPVWLPIWHSLKARAGPAEQYLAHYFIHGVFDPWDVLAIATAVVAAVILAKAATGRSKEDHSEAEIPASGNCRKADGGHYWSARHSDHSCVGPYSTQRRPQH